MKITSGDTVAIELAGAQITLPAATVADLWLERIKGGATRATGPRIGDAYAGGIYMGVVRVENGERDYRIIDLGGTPEAATWAVATEWAKSKGGALPTRRELAVLFGNRGEGQFQETWHWSCEQYAGSSDYAWIQDFTGGDRDNDHVVYRLSARAVRREVL